jgi:hypothetical protein
LLLLLTCYATFHHLSYLKILILIYKIIKVIFQIYLTINQIIIKIYF